MAQRSLRLPGTCQALPNLARLQALLASRLRTAFQARGSFARIFNGEQDGIPGRVLTRMLSFTLAFGLVYRGWDADCDG